MLYRKVCKGQYQPIPSHFSKELASLISKMLQVKARDRPSCGELLASKEVRKWQSKLDESIVSGTGLLIDQIKMPKQLSDLRGRFPKSKYEVSDTSSIAKRLKEASRKSSQQRGRTRREEHKR